MAETVIPIHQAQLAEFESNWRGVGDFAKAYFNRRLYGNFRQPQSINRDGMTILKAHRDLVGLSNQARLKN
jgi:hypothetical protein